MASRNAKSLPLEMEDWLEATALVPMRPQDPSEIDEEEMMRLWCSPASTDPFVFLEGMSLARLDYDKFRPRIPKRR